MKHRMALVAILALALSGCGSPTPSATLPAQPPAGTPSTDPGGYTGEPGFTGEPTPASEPTPLVGQVGAPLTVTSQDPNTGQEKVSRVTLVSARYSQDPLGSYDTGPKKGGYLIIEVLWESQTGTADVNPLLFNAKDATGVQQRPGYTSGDLDLLPAADVPAGDKLRGFLVFDIAAGPWIVTMGAFTEAARWTITNA